MLQTEHDFELPKGYVDADGNVHRTGTMRLARAIDEIVPLKDVRVEKNPAYLIIILLSRVVVRLGSVKEVTPKVIENLFTDDLLFLHDTYRRINGDPTVALECPKCGHGFELQESRLGKT